MQFSRARAFVRPITNFLLLSVPLAVFLVLLVRLSKKIDVIQEEMKSVGELRAQILELDHWHRLPVLADMKEARLGGRSVKYKDYPIPKQPVLGKYWNPNDVPSASWHPNDRKLPYSYPTRFAYRGAPFHPWEFLQNAVALCNYAEQHQAMADVESLIGDMMNDLQANLDSSGGALFFRYPFPHQFYDLKVPTGWVSGFGNAAVLCGLIKLYQTTKKPHYRELAGQVVAAFKQICDSPGQSAPWFAYVDSRDYLWFEEFPSAKANQTHIMNGHIFCLMALDYYLSINPHDRDEVLLLLRAGIATMQSYLCEYRRPGMVNRYSLYAPWLFKTINVDYMPSRTIDCADWLYRVSGESSFKTLAEAFRSDHPCH